MAKHSVLIVDDEKLFLDLHSQILEAEGFEVYTAENGVECLEAVKKRKPDLILMDMKMPVMDGDQTLVKLQEDPEFKDVKVIFLTALGDPLTDIGDRQLAKSVGATDYLKKGSGKAELVKMVKKYLPD